MVLVLAIAGVAATVAAGLLPQRYTPPPTDVGRVAMPTSCAAEAQGHVERGVALLHSFWYEEARRAFELAAEADPDCGMAYWGQAMTWTHPLWDPPSAHALARGLEAERRGQAVGAPTARERAYIGAVVAMYDGAPEVPQHTRMRRYRDVMARLAEAHRDDKEAVAFYALALLSVPGGGEYEGELKAAALLEREFGRAPDHPGAAHYLIHAYDNPPHAAKGLPAADTYASIAPAVPHALHMPSHIYTRLGLWDRAARSNEAAWAASDAHLMPEAMHGGSRDYHSLQWLLYARLQMGQFKQAAEIMTLIGRHADAEREQGKVGEGDYLGASYHLSDMAARDALERGRWDEAMAVSDGGTARHAEGTRWFARGLGAARAAWPGAKADAIAIARDVASRLDALAAREGRRGLAEMERLGVLAAIAAAHEEAGEMAVLLAQATALEIGRAHV